ncbi:MAG: AAA family ATPase [Myxococcales bacterium]|nr:AAA family ATPase [Myxococcales bacterium]
MQFRRYTPEAVLRRIAADPTPPESPTSETTPAAVLWADISGFTRLTERLVADGPMGVETLTEYLNAYFDRLIGIIHAHGGDVIQFEGDAVLCLWRPEDDPSLDRLTQRATQCALDIQRQMGRFDVGDGVALSQRVAIGAGRVRLFWVGGVLARWTVVVAGDPLRQVQDCSHDVQPGEVVASPEAWALVSTRCRGAVLNRGSAHVQAITAPLPVAPLRAAALPEGAERAVRVFLHGAVLARAGAGQGRWLAELRTVTVLFVHLPELDPAADDILALSQAITEQTQHAIYRWGGSIDKISMADKGATLLAGFGIPPLAHEDDATRGVRAALDIVGRLKAIGVRASVGVTTGQVFCGVVGSGARCEYTTLGRAVNLASRLMQLADGGVLVDEATYQAAQHRLGFESLDAVRVKGVPEPVPIHRPTGELRAVVRQQTELVGRGDEQALIAARLQDLLRERTPGVLVFEGEAGIGKSRLVHEVVRRAAELEARVLMAEATSIERESPYHAWRPLVAELLALPRGLTADEALAHVEAGLAFDPALAPLAPLMDAVLPLDLEDNETTEQMPGEVRAANLNDLLVRLLQRAAEAEPLVIVVEDVHWLDSASWTLLDAVGRAVQPALLVLATRPLPDPPPAAWTRLVEAPGADHVVLGNLSPEDTLQLVCQRLGVVHLPDAVGALLTDKSGGNPFFTEELAFSLRDTGLLLVHDGTCGLAPGADLETLVLPDTVQGAVISRVDRLPASQQLLLKVASVIGREFAYRILAHVYPAEETGDDVGTLLPPLLDLDLIIAEGETTVGPQAYYVFKHAIGQEAIYGLMLFKQRRELHRRVAEFYERRPPNELVALYPLLAHHWTKAEEKPRALDYLHKAGDQALQRFANIEAARFFERALALCAEGVAAPRERVRRLYEGLAEARFRTGEYPGCLAASADALELLDAAPARTPARTVFSLAGAVGRRLLYGAFPALGRVDDEARREIRLAAARLYGMRAEIAVFTDDPLSCVYGALVGLNLASTAGPSAELGRAYTVMSIILGAVPLPKVADAWTDRAVALGRTLDKPLDRGFILCRSGAYRLYRGRWDVAAAYTAEALAIAERLGDRRLREDVLVVTQFGLMFQGAFGAALPVLDRMVASSLTSGNQQTLGWGRACRSYVRARLGKTEQALEDAPFLEAWVPTVTTAERFLGLGGLAQAYLAAGDHDKALATADRTFDLINRPIAYWMLVAISSTAEVYAEAYARRPDPLLLKRLKSIAKSARAFGKVFVFGESAGLFHTGVYEAARGRGDRAVEAWRKCIERSEALGTRFEMTQAHRALARHLPAEDPARGTHASLAETLWTELAAETA